MSALLSPLKSPVPMTCQEEPGLDNPIWAIGVVPFISQIAGIPLLFWNSRSLAPSPLKSMGGGGGWRRVIVPPEPAAVTENTGLVIGVDNEICAKVLPPFFRVRVPGE